MLKPVEVSSHDIVLPALEASGMVSSLEDADMKTPSASYDSRKLGEDSHENHRLAHPPQSNSPWRLGRLLSLVIPPLLASFILYGWYFASRFIIPFLCRSYPGIICTIYTYTFHFLLATTTSLFLFIWLSPNTHSEPPRSLPRLLQVRRVPHEVASLDGDYNECWQDNCKGRIIPPRARHCKDCRVCRLDFDHHCPWLGCISRDTFKAFILFLGIATLTIAVGLAPVYPLAWWQYRHVMAHAWQQDYIYDLWWNKRYSYLGGPLYRYLGAAALAYYRYEHAISLKADDSVIRDIPITGVLFFYSILGTILAVFCTILFVNSLHDAAVATSTIETARTTKRHKLGVSGDYACRYIQMAENAEHGSAGSLVTPEVRKIPTNIKLYDFGVVENLKRVFGRSLREYISPWPPHLEPSEHWQISSRALAYLDVPPNGHPCHCKCD
ncbi:hypothetical protein P389DRAFT_175460 [Cystobasidium minutum MCA 4210]|uniref:uncharacterized protein n=1 Tax=Cystobasidium minutum MCA 4210 TaxID=1397322 RepID=UPI0034D006D1|eukprot:jgi/Rhomi1/175460/fgenesh1_kg.10_\